ncbi:hypothetical protein BD626DRAFT_192807 [Schizophyllum amplum]|uniref:Methyltransferase-domain-containing protein n=1 Tax=Schizophyllum amplum TaxID=97359 RepID=A0A550CM06_9AGAR|nr:hypothetical protein BD626DRAFT_192807 [Auriculariopsis ampla]
MNDRIYNRYLEVLNQQLDVADSSLSCPPPTDSFITHYWRLKNSASSKNSLVNLDDYRTLTLRESRTTIQDGTTGLRTWLASLVLSEYLIDTPDLIANKRILELGSGIGFLGIICASLQRLHQTTESAPPPHLWLTDANEDVLTKCRGNVQLPCNLSSTHPNVHHRLLDWTAFEHSASRSTALADMDALDEDIILGADIVFDPALIEPFVTVLALRLFKLRQNGPRVALIALTVRNPDTFQAFLDAVERAALTVEHVDYQSSGRMFLERRKVKRTRLHR